MARPDSHTAAAEVVVAAMQDDIMGALAEATALPPDPNSLEGQAVALAAIEPAAEDQMTPLPDETQIAALAADSAAPLTTEPQVLSVTAAPALTQPVQLVAGSPKPKRLSLIHI